MLCIRMSLFFGLGMQDLSYKMLEGGFPDEEICIFLELLDLP